jgi:hypothetical protein
MAKFAMQFAFAALKIITMPLIIVRARNQNIQLFSIEHDFNLTLHFAGEHPAAIQAASTLQIRSFLLLLVSLIPVIIFTVNNGR